MPGGVGGNFPKGGNCAGVGGIKPVPLSSGSFSAARSDNIFAAMNVSFGARVTNPPDALDCGFSFVELLLIAKINSFNYTLLYSQFSFR